LQALMVLFRFLDLSWATLDRVLALRAKMVGMPYRSSEDLKRDYEAVDRLL
jgi:hypothetical protein